MNIIRFKLFVLLMGIVLNAKGQNGFNQLWQIDTVGNTIDSTLLSIRLYSKRGINNFCKFNSTKEFEVITDISSISLPLCMEDFDSLSIIHCPKTTIRNPEILIKFSNLQILYCCLESYNNNLTNNRNIFALYVGLTRQGRHDTIKFYRQNSLKFITYRSNKKLVFDTSFNYLGNLVKIDARFNPFDKNLGIDSSKFKNLNNIHVYKVDFRKILIDPELVSKFCNIKIGFSNCKFTANQVEILRRYFKNQLNLNECKIY